MHQLIVSRLIESGYQVFFPIGMSSTELLVRNPSGDIQVCRAQTASIDGSNSSVLKVSGKFDIIAAYDPVSKNVWVIPREIVKERVAIRLGKRYDDYLIPKPQSVEYRGRREAKKGFLEKLKDRAKEVGEDQKGEQS